MPFPVAAAIAGGAALVNAFGGRGRRGAIGRSVRGINSRYLPMRAEGYTTANDIADAARLRESRAKSIGAFGSDALGQSRARFAARGAYGSPALERSAARIGQQQGGMLENAALAGEGLISDRYAGREGFERDKILRAWGAEVGAAGGDFSREQAQQSAFWNSINEYAGAVGPMLAGTPSPTVPTNALASAADYAPPIPQPRGR